LLSYLEGEQRVPQSTWRCLCNPHLDQQSCLCTCRWVRLWCPVAMSMTSPAASRRQMTTGGRSHLPGTMQVRAALSCCVASFTLCHRLPHAVDCAHTCGLVDLQSWFPFHQGHRAVVCHADASSAQLLLHTPPPVHQISAQTMRVFLFGKESLARLSASFLRCVGSR
jgi:hypothetical protein